MKPKKSHAGDSNLAINAAKSFFTLAGSFFQSVPIDPAAIPAYLKGREGMLVAATTNLAFSVELLLKAIAIKTLGQATDGHKLIDRFLDLPIDIRESIEQCYRYRIAHDRHQNFGPLEFSVYPSRGEPSEAQKQAGRLNRAAGDSVSSLLEAEKDAFHVWRYFYERANPNHPVCVLVHYRRMGTLVNSIEDQFVPPHQRPNYRPATQS